jgi:hypothetical protein
MIFVRKSTEIPNSAFKFPSNAQNKKIPSPLFLKIFERWGSGGRKLSKKVFFPRNKKTKKTKKTKTKYKGA